MIIDSLLLLLAMFMLWFGAKYLVESAGRIAATFGVSDLVIGLTVVAFGTSAPEFSVTIGAALSGKSDISVSNIVGSNIFNLGFILGAVAIVRAVNISKKLVYRDGLFMIGITFLLLFFFRDLVFIRLEGIIMISLQAAYLILLFVRKDAPEDDKIQHKKAAWKDYILLPASIATVVIGGHFLVESAGNIARMAGLSEWVIGITIVAAGTSAPEMATSLAAVLKGKHGISAGNLIGSNIFNILGVLGVAGALKSADSPLTITSQGLSSLVMMSGMVILAVFMMRTGWRISRLDGIILVFIGLLCWIFDFMK
jgi:cation:H+ antiporter